MIAATCHMVSQFIRRDVQTYVNGFESNVICCKRVDMVFFFFSSRRRHTRLQGDWSSDVCSSDLTSMLSAIDHVGLAVEDIDATLALYSGSLGMPLVHRETVDEQGVEAALLDIGDRSEERRVGKECRSRWSPYH